MRRMIAALFVVGVLAGAPGRSRADGPTILWMDLSPEGREHAAALALELAERDAQVVATLAPPGASVTTRAETAQGAARARGADAALWLEREDGGARSVRAVAADRTARVWAPLRDDGADARVVALIAASLIDELLAEPASTTVTIRVPAPPPSSASTSASAATPASASAASVASDPGAASAPPVHARTAAAASPAIEAPPRRDFYVELGPTWPVIGLGAHGGVGFYLHHNVRWDFRLRGAYMFLDQSGGGTLTTSVAWVSDDEDARVEIGLEPGLVFTSSGPGLFGVAYGGVSWPFGPDLRLGGRLGAGIVYVDPGADVIPAVLLDLYLQVTP